MDGALAIVRAVHLAACVVLFGELAFVAFVAPARAAPPRFKAALGWSIAVAAASAIAWLAIEAVAMSGLPASEALTPATLGTVLGQTMFGHVWLIRLVLLAVCAAALVAGSAGGARTRHAIAFAAAFAFVAMLACMGHAGAARGGELAIRLVADGAHVVAASAWLGALLPLILVVGDGMRHGEPDRVAGARAASQRFSTLGIVSVGTILVSGIVSACYALHRLPALYETGYGRMVGAKIVLFAAMLGFAAINRFRLAPRLDAMSLRLLRRNSIFELLLGIVIVCIAAQLGITMPPAAHHHMGAMGLE